MTIQPVLADVKPRQLLKIIVNDTCRSREVMVPSLKWNQKVKCEWEVGRYYRLKVSLT